MNELEKMIYQIYTLKAESDEKYINKLVKITTLAEELEKLTEGLYRLEKTTYLNKISIKGYVLESDICKELLAKNISNYSVDDLINYIDSNYSEDKQNIRKLLDLYKQFDEIELLQENTIDFLEKELPKILNESLEKYHSSKDKEVEAYHQKVLDKVLSELYNTGIIDSSSYSYLIQLLNTVKNYYIFGYKPIID